MSGLKIKENPNLSTEKKPTILIVRKLGKSEENRHKIIKREINNYFLFPEKYFEFNTPITVGKKIKFRPYVEHKTNSPKSNKQRKSLLLNNTNSIVSRNKQSIDQNQENKYELIDNEKLKKIFNSFRSLSKNIKKENNNKFLPTELKKCLYSQNKKLSNKKAQEEETNKLAKYLSLKSKRKENSLLLNNLEIFRYNKEIINEIEENKPIEEKYGNFKWNISLRRPERFQGTRNSYINLKNDYDPYWSIVIEKIPKIKEFTVKPLNSISCEKNELKKLNKKYDMFYNTIENLENLEIEGKNLFNLEYNREMGSKNKKILHKVFVENGRSISNSEINHLYGNETFYKNYKNFKLNLKDCLKTCKNKKNLYLSTYHMEYK